MKYVERKSSREQNYKLSAKKKDYWSEKNTLRIGVKTFLKSLINLLNKIIDRQQDIKLGHFTEEELDAVLKCSTMWVGCQSRRFISLFWRETRQRILGPEISPYPEVGRGRERELTGDPDESSWRWTAERRAEESWRGTTDRGSQHRTPEQRGEAAWDRVQRLWVKMSLIPVALWNFR